jgi:hypothetical protein
MNKHLGRDYIKHIKILFMALLIATLTFGTGAVSASSATGVHVTSTTVTAFGWNSCSKGWYKTGGTFENYCPFCGGHGTLTFNPKGTYEGEWTCKRCDSDFCLCGRCKASGSGVYLIKAVVGKKSQTTTNIPVSAGVYISPLSIIKNKLNEPWAVI